MGTSQTELPLPEGAASGPAGRRLRRFFDPVFQRFTALCAVLIVALVIGTVYLLFAESRSTMFHFGTKFITSTTWDPNSSSYGILTAIYGTLASTAIALLIAVPLALLIALLLVEFAPPALSRTVGTMVEMLAAIPSIIFGMWSLIVLAPFLGNHIEPWLGSHLGFLPIFNGSNGYLGYDVFTAGVILALMILPFITAVVRDVLNMVPPMLKEAGYAVGSSTWEIAHKISMRHGSAGIIGAIILGLGRAIGETMAVAFVVGSSTSWGGFSLFNPGYTISSLIATKFGEAQGIELGALTEAAFVLLVMELFIQLAAQTWLRRARAKTGGRA
ncbi:MAG: phosphate ABC transporter permease subunit PstC [Thermoleophilia bacterium]